ncbi:MAG: response regulator [Acidobacteria bacterium]|nr:response regulator [Acidobacteriota bacterium]
MNAIGLVALILWFANPQTPFIHFTTGDGLSQDVVTFIYRDRTGFLWVGTEGGLNRFDGNEFVVYRHDPNDATSLSNNEITVIFEDSKGRFWIGTDGGGLNLMDRDRQIFERFVYLPDNPKSLPHNVVSAICEDLDGSLWVGTEAEGLRRLDIATNQFEMPISSDRLTSDEITSLAVDREGSLWIGTEDGLNRIHTDSREISRWVHDPDTPDSLPSNKVQALMCDRDGDMWVAFEDAGVAKYHVASQSFHHFFDRNSALSHNEVVSLAEDWHGNVWLATEGGGLNCWHRETAQIRVFRHDGKDSGSLSNDVVTAAYYDKANLWVGTEGGGLNQMFLSPSPFRPLPLDHAPHFILSVFEDQKGELWVGTKDEGVFHQTDAAWRIYSKESDTGIQHNDVSTMIQSPDGDFWIGTDGGGLHRYDSATGRFDVHTLPKPLADVGSNEVTVIVARDDGRIWVGFDGGGLALFGPETNNWIVMRHDPSDSKSLSHNKVMSVMEDKQGFLWVGTEGGGLNRGDDRRWFTHFDSNQPAQRRLSGDDVFALLEDSSGRLWVGTNVGLCQLNQERQVTRFYLESDGLPNELVYGLHEDKDNNLWVATSDGLAELNPELEQLEVHVNRGGLLNRGAFGITAQGELMLGGAQGVTLFDPSHTHLGGDQTRLILTDFQIFNKSVPVGPDSTLEKAIHRAQHLDLSYRDDLFSFKFANLDLSPARAVQFAYKLEGFDAQWHYIGDHRTVDFNNVPPGAYTFKVRAVTADQRPMGPDTQIKLNIHPPIWKTWPAYLFYGLMGMFVLSAVIRLRTRVHRREIERQRHELEQERQVTERLRQVDRLKDHFLANTSHELRTPLTGMIGIADSLIDGAAGELNGPMRKNLEMIVQCGQRLAGLVNDILDFSTLKNKQLQLLMKDVDLRATVDAVLALNQSYVQLKSLALLNDVPQGLVVHADENRLIQVLQNLIGNAVKFTHQGEVRVSATRSSDRVAIAVSDTGIGIPSDQFDRIFQSFEQVDSSSSRNYGGTGLGLHISQQLVQLHGGSIQVASQVGRGSCFRFDVAQGVSDTINTQSPASARRQKIRSVSDWDVPEHEDANATRILVVDDEPSNLQVLGNQLNLAGFHVELVTHGAAALQAMESFEPDLVLLDVMMPGMTGFEVCRKIRNRFASYQLPIIFLTAKNRVSDLVEGFQQGANDYLTKPFSKQELLARVRTHIGLTKMNRASSRFVPRQFLENLSKDSLLDIQLGDHIQKEMTVLFSDIRSFTALSEQMTPEENFRFVNQYFQHMGPLVRQHGGFIDKFIGDAIMALFDQKPDDALDSAIAMLHCLERENLKRIQQGTFPIHIGIGINTGTLMLGTVGESDRMESTVISDAVNLASRLEGLTKTYGVPLLISEHTRRKLNDPDRFDLRPLGEVQVKGKQQMVTIYEVLNGHTQDEHELRMGTKTLFSHGIECFREHDLKGAHDLFRQVLDRNPADRVARHYCRETDAALNRALAG